MKPIKQLNLGMFLGLLLLAGCSRDIRPPTQSFSNDFHPDIESGQFSAPQSYRAELQGDTRWEQLEKQTLTVSHEKQSKIAAELDIKLAQEIAQEQKQTKELLEKNQQLQRELRKSARKRPK